MNQPTTNKILHARRESAIPKGPFNVTARYVSKANGAKLIDVEGKEYIDFCGGIGVTNVGHNHPRVVEAIKRQADQYLHTSFHVMPYEPYVTLAERLNDAVPIDAPCKTAFFNSGAEAVENAVKIARVATERTGVVCMERGFHGRTLMGMTLTGKAHPYTAGFGPFAPEVYRLPYAPFFNPDKSLTDDKIAANCHTVLSNLGQYHIEPESIACLIVEPVLGEGGFFPIHPRAYETLRQWTEANGIVLIADEIQTGFARCGALLATERYDIKPDMVTMAKSLAGGMVLSAVTGKANLMEAPGVGGIGGTYGGNPLACAAALAVLDIIDEEQLSAAADKIGETVMSKFAEIKKENKWVSDIRHLGAMCAMEFKDPQTGDPAGELVAKICAEAANNGLIIMSASKNSIRTLMPLTISDDELNKGLDILEKVIRTCS